MNTGFKRCIQGQSWKFHQKRKQKESKENAKQEAKGPLCFVLSNSWQVSNSQNHAWIQNSGLVLSFVFTLGFASCEYLQTPWFWVTHDFSFGTLNTHNLTSAVIPYIVIQYFNFLFWVARMITFTTHLGKTAPYCTLQGVAPLLINTASKEKYGSIPTVFTGQPALHYSKLSSILIHF